MPSYHIGNNALKPNNVTETELDLIKYASVKDKRRFDINAVYMTWLREWYVVFGKPVPDSLKKKIKQTIPLWSKDEFALFNVLIDKTWTDNKYECPKCNKQTYFTPTRFKKLVKMLQTKKCVTVEKPRTLSCEFCSFTFNPLSLGPYAQLRSDLRTWIVYQFLTEDGQVKFPVSSIAKILNVSYGTAKRIIEHKTPASRKDWAEYNVNKMPKQEDGDIDHNWWKGKILMQYIDFKYGKSIYKETKVLING